MKPDRLPPIPIPLKQRWQDARLRLAPILVFGAVWLVIGLLWKDYVAAPTMVGQAEPVLAQVSSHKPGVLAELRVTRFQTVKAGDLIGRVIIADPKILTSSLAVVQAEIDLLRANMEPIAAQQQRAVVYGRLRLDWMRQRADLAAARVELQLAESEYARNQELFQDKILSQQALDQAKAARDGLQDQVHALAQLVTEAEGGFQQMQITNLADISKVSDTPLVAAIAAQESKLRLAEAELSPISLTAPMDGIVNVVYRHAGEAVVPGEPILTIATLAPVRIVGYLRPPIFEEPQAGMRVQIRSRNPRRQAGWGSIVKVGSQLETIPPTMLGPVPFAEVIQGLPIDITLPPELKIRPGELVDIFLTDRQESNGSAL